MPTMHPRDPTSVALVGTYVPRRCGIATFTRDLRDAIAVRLPRDRCLVVALEERGQAHDYPPEARFTCAADEEPALVRAADFLHLAGVDVVSLQHEYGIFGGPDGAHVLGLLEALRIPVHTTLHTVLTRPSPGQRRVLAEVARLSARLVVMTEGARALLRDEYGVVEGKVDVIPHGIPDMPFVDPAIPKARFGLQGRDVLLTFGLLSPGKGIEHAIAALPRIVDRHPCVTYVVLGATHPCLVRTQGEAYREALEALADELGVREHVVFHDRYVDMPELLAFLGATDIYLTPYVNEQQATSGTLAYAFGCGKVVVSTPYRHAAELLADDRGALVPFADPDALATAVAGLLSDPDRRHALRTRAWHAGREMTWDRVAARYAESFRHAREALQVRPRRPAPRPASPVARPHLPPLVFDHLWRLTDSTGLLQHATFDVPNLAEGYCTDDNARALALMVLVDDLGGATPRTRRAAAVYAAFLAHAFVPATGRFRNFMGFDRRWTDEAGSDDTLGRAVLALGTCLGRARSANLRRWAAGLFEPALRAALRTTSPRCWALAILGTQEYLRRLDGDRLATGVRRDLTARLLARRRDAVTDDWPWLEDVVAYDNARPCQALISAGRWTGDGAALAAGLEMLSWLGDLQRCPAGRFAPVGCHGFYPRGGAAAAFDQQPLEAHAMVAACIEAYHATGTAAWLDRAWEAFDWFRGQNVLGVALCDPHTGGCRDGLLEDRANENQGAESTLAWLGALVDMRFLERHLAARRPASEAPPAAARPCS